jgi:hypothetical protein
MRSCAARMGHLSSLVRSRPLLAAGLAIAAGAALLGCGDTLQTQPIDNHVLEKLVTARGAPIYWVSGTFDGMQISNIERDTGGTYALQYGNCSIGGQGICVTPLAIITSRDNSFLPGGTTGRQIITIRGRHAALAEGGRTIEIPTGRVVVTITADTPARALRAANLMVPLNALIAPGDPLPQALPDTGVGRTPPAGATGPTGPSGTGGPRVAGR